MKTTLAKYISNILNPFLIAVIIIILLSLKEGDGIENMVAWLFITIGISVAPVLIIVYLLVRMKKLDSFFSNPREQRNIVYVLASIIGIIDCVIIWYLKAPKLLAVIFTAGSIAVVLFLIINCFWKISLHTAFVTATIVILIIEYGPWALFTAAALPLVAWSRLVLKQHNIMQVAIGSLLAAVIVFGVFWGFGMLGSG